MGGERLLEAKNPRDHVMQADTIVYRASSLECEQLLAQTGVPCQYPASQDRSQYLWGARDVARQIAQTDEFKQSSQQRKKIEMLFAHLKRNLKPDRQRLRDLRVRSARLSLRSGAQSPIEPSRRGKQLQRNTESGR